MGAPVVQELLTTRNYAKWIVWMNAYLLGKGLWEIVVGMEPEHEQLEEERAWKMKNGKALHAILVSCGDEILPIIRGMASAKGAWNEIWAFMLPYQEWNEIWPFMVPHYSSVVDLQGPSTSAGTSIDYNTWHRRKLYDAVVKDDWVAVKLEIGKWEDLIHPVLMDQTLLHIAVLHDHVDFVKELLNEISPEHTEITLPNQGNFTALHLAVGRGNLEMVRVLLDKNPNLLCLKDKYDRLPLTIACFMNNKAIVKYLKAVTARGNMDRLPLTTASLSDNEAMKDIPREDIDYFSSAQYLIQAILDGDYDRALAIYQDRGLSPFAENEEGLTPLQALAGKPSAFPSGNQLKFWQRLIYKCINVQQDQTRNIEGNVASNARGLFKKIYAIKLSNKQAIELLVTMRDYIISLNDSKIDKDAIQNAMETAYRFGNDEFAAIMAKYDPTLLEGTNSVRSMLSTAITYRQERIWATIFYSSSRKKGFSFDTPEELGEGKSLLHEVAKLPPRSILNKVSGPAMQMQRELQWFKEVESIAPQHLLKGRNYWKDMTARELFTDQHKHLVKEAEDWMKQTSSSCMVVATLIATVMFAAAFTVPGGNGSETGIPILLTKTSFLVFVVADALSLFSSTASILMFLSILTSRFAQEDFLKSLPKKLIMGLATLFSSIATMMVAFSATLVIVLQDRYEWVAIPIISLLATVPVALFAFLQLPLFVDMVLSTYGPNIFREQTNSVFDSVPTRPVVQTSPVHTDSVQTSPVHTDPV